MQSRFTVEPQERLVSLDVFRGLTMFLLVAEGAGIYHALLDPALRVPFVGTLAVQFTHHPWNGLRFWDLVQPYFMFIVGVAMPFSFTRRWNRGESYRSTFKHALTRSLILLSLGIGVYVVTAGRLVFELWNVLAQLSFTYFLAFLVMRKSTRTQLIISFCLLLVTEGLYRFWPIEGFNLPFTPDKNFGSWVDLLMMGKLSAGHWVAFNAVPTAAHTIWGVLAGYLIQSNLGAWRKIRILVLTGLAGIILGYSMDPITPIIKRISTTSFVIVSGGWCLLTLAFFFWLNDIQRIRKGFQFAVVFGMNPLFIYLFSLLGGNAWLSEIVVPFSEGFLSWLGEPFTAIITAALVLWMDWYLVHFLFRERVFIKI